jgi:hypothetical protein
MTAVYVDMHCHTSHIRTGQPCDKPAHDAVYDEMLSLLGSPFPPAALEIRRGVCHLVGVFNQEKGVNPP